MRDDVKITLMYNKCCRLKLGCLRHMGRKQRGRLGGCPRGGRLGTGAYDACGGLSLNCDGLGGCGRTLGRRLGTCALVGSLCTRGGTRLKAGCVLVAVGIDIGCCRGNSGRRTLRCLRRTSTVTRRVGTLFPRCFTACPVIIGLTGNSLLDGLSRPKTRRLLGRKLRCGTNSRPGSTLLLCALGRCRDGKLCAGWLLFTGGSFP